MNSVVRLVGNIAAVIGVVFCFVAGVTRLTGHFHLLGVETEAFFQAGIALMVFGCLTKLHVLLANRSSARQL